MTEREQIGEALRDALEVYRASLPTAYQSLLERYQLRDAAIKVVGIGRRGSGTSSGSRPASSLRADA